MPNRAAIVTGASRGIGYAIADALGADGYDLTISARKPDTLEQAAGVLRGKGYDVEAVALNLRDEAAVADIVRRHDDRFGRLDVLVNNAGVGIGAAAGDHETKMIDMQLAVNVRSIILFYRECLGLLRQAGAEHHKALVVNMASMAGKRPQPWLSVYGATKAAVVAYTLAMNAELGKEGITSVAFCPGWVDTDMTDFIKGEVPAEEMLRTSDIVEAVRFLLRVSPACVVPEIVFARPGENW
jgi:NAD(P)-dependent dehydrogenase (short-subunit alcohol dehydrogenase family)